MSAASLASVSDVPGPIVVTGAGGFIGAHLVSALQAQRDDVFGTARDAGNWRVRAFGQQRVFETHDVRQLLKVADSIRPRTIFNLAAHGAYSFQTSPQLIAQTNFGDLLELTNWAEAHDCSIVQAGSSSEYGWNSAAPPEGAVLEPNSLYAVTKAAASHWLAFRSRVGQLNACVLRLYSIYGPGEDPARLFPTLIRLGLNGDLPPLALEETSRDFVFVDDTVEAFIRAGALVRSSARGQVLNIATGVKTSMREVAQLAVREFGLEADPQYGGVVRPWDLQDWYGDARLAGEVLGWSARTALPDGLHQTRVWYQGDGHLPLLSIDFSRDGVDPQDERPCQLSAVVACYRDAQAIPHMYERLRDTLEGLGLKFEIIFVNDASPDDSLEVIEAVSLDDARVRGITHSRNFGSQAAFLSGMRAAVGENVVLLDGDLQDPPELIAEFWARRLAGYDVVYGRRVDREASWFMRRAYKGFYRVFQALAPFRIPRDAGDFSLMSRPVVDVITEMPERDLFIRAQRAYVGFRQTGVDYRRPERMFGASTNNLGKNLGWATRGVLAVSRAPLTGLSLFALGLFGLSLILIAAQLLSKILMPSIAPEGLLSVSVGILGLGSLNLLAIAIVGEYVGRILEEVKRRPRYVRRLLTEFGVTRAEARVVGGASVDA